MKQGLEIEQAEYDLGTNYLDGESTEYSLLIIDNIFMLSAYNGTETRSVIKPKGKKS